MSLDEIGLFVDVVESGGFRAAAQRAGVSPGSVSKRIKALEERLQVQLLHRSSRRVELTQTGRSFYEEVRGLPAQLAAAEERLRDHTGQVRGSLRVIMPDYFAIAELVEELVPSFLAAHPEVDLRLELTGSPLRAAREGFDLLIIGRLPFHPLPELDTKGRRLVSLRGALFASPDYLEARGTPAHPDELAQHDLLGLLNPLWHFVPPDGAAPLVHRIQPVLSTNSIPMLRAALLAGQGIAYAFPSSFRPDVVAGRLVRIMEEWTAGARVEVYGFYPRTDYLPARTRAFLDLLLAHLAQGK